MRSCKTISKILVGILLCLCGLGCISWNVVTKAKEQRLRQIDMQVTIGFDDNKVKLSRENTVHVKVFNHEEKDISGYVSVSGVVEDDEASNEARTYIKVKANDTKTVDIPIYLCFDLDWILVSVYDSKGKSLCTSQLALQNSSANDIVLGVLGKNKDDYKYLQYQLVDQIMFFSQKTFPTTSYALSCTDILLCEKVSLDKLDYTQLDAIKKWIADGGTLILADAFSKNGVNLQQLGYGYTTEKICRKKCNKTIQEAGIKAYQIQMYQGSIVVFPNALAEKVYGKSKGWDQISHTYVNIIKQGYGRNMEKHSYADYFDTGSVGNIDTTVAVDDLPRITVVAVLLIVYICVIGFGLRWYLLKRDRLEYIWIYLPICAFCFVAIVFGIGSKTRIRGVHMDYGNIAEYSQESNVVKVESNMKFYTASNKDYRVRIPEGMHVWAYSQFEWNSNSITYNPDWKKKIIHENMEKDTYLTFTQNRAFEKRSVHGSYEVTKQGNYTANLSCKLNAYSGTITNEMGCTMQQAILLAGKKVYLLGDIPSGVTISVNEKLPHTNLNCIELLNTHSKVRSWFLFGDKDKEQQDRYASTDYLGIVLNYLDRGSGVSNLLEPKILCILDQNYDSVSDWHIKTNGKTLSSCLVQVDYQDNGETFLPDIIATCKDASLGTELNWVGSENTPINIQFHSGERVTGIYYQKEMNTINKTKEDKNSFEMKRFDGMIQMYNYVTGRYETVMNDLSKDQSVTDLSEYINKKNVMRLRLLVDKEVYVDDEIMPVLSATIRKE